MRPIRVLHVCTIFLTARTFVAPVLRHLQACGYAVAVACSRGGADDGPVDLERPWDVACPIYPVAIPRTINLFADARAVWQLVKWIRQFKPDIVHTQTSKAGFVGRLASKLAGVPIVIHTAHAFPFHPYLTPFVRAAYVAIERIAAQWADCLIVDTHSVRADGIEARVVKDSSKLVVVPMGIDLHRFSPTGGQSDTLRGALGAPSGVPIVGTVARLVPDKGMECFLKMAALVHNSRSDTHFLIVGEGPLRQQLEQQARSLCLESRVIFVGHRTDIPELMGLMDVFVLPTRREGFGVVFAEAMAMERPIVGSRIGPVAEVVEEGVTGYLAAVDNHGEFAARVLDLLADASKRRVFGQAGRRRVERLFSEEVMCRTIEGHYRRLLTNKGLV